MTRRVAAWLLSLSGVIGTQAAAKEPRIAVNLPGGPLGRAVDALTQQAVVNIILGDPELWSRRVPVIRGWMTAESAVLMLSRLAHVRAVRVTRSGWRLTAAPRAAVPIPARRPARAAAPAEDPVADIIVQASRRGTAARDFAGSVEIVSGLEPSIEGGTQALVTRSTIISSTYRGAGREKLFIRGISDSAFSGRLQSVTGLYLGEARLIYNASDPGLQLYDLSSVEILQGPQGTLYGSGSLAGTIRLNPNMPRRNVATGTVGGGLSTVAHGAQGGDVDAMVNLPVTGTLAVRAVGYARSEAGFIDRPATGRDVNRTDITGGRVIARWWPGGGWTVDGVVTAQESRSRDAQYATVGASPLTVSGTIPEPYGGSYIAGHVVLSGRIGALDLISTTGIASQDFDERFAADYPQFSRVTDLQRRYDMTTHETRISRHADDGSGWLAGLSYIHASSRFDYLERLLPGGDRKGDPPFESRSGLVDRTTEATLFAEGTVRIAPFLMLGGGARAVVATTRTTFDVSPIVEPEARRREKWLLPTASVLLAPFSNLSAYVRYQQGARPGIPPRAFWRGTISLPTERIETLDAGMEWRSRGGWHVSASIGRSYWRNLQTDTFEGAVFSNLNLGDWRLASIHAAVDGPVHREWSIEAAATLNRARPVTLSGLGLDLRAPDIAGIIVRSGVTWTRRVDHATSIGVNAWMRYEGPSYGVNLLDMPQRQGDYVRTGVSASIDRGRHRLSLSADNLLNARATRYVYGNLLLAGMTVTPLQPTSVRLGYRRIF